MINRKSMALRTDVLVIGGGGAGLRAAISARERGADVLLVSKSRVGFGNNTYISKATFAAPLAGGDPRDCAKVHLEDTLKAGRFLNDEQLALLVSEKAADQIGFLEECGVRFMKREDSLRFFLLPGHSYPRHVRGQRQTGSDFVLPLLSRARRAGVRMMDRLFITRLIRDEAGFAGALGIRADGELAAVSVKSCVLATGGFGRIYRNTNNASGITGDGHILAYDLGLPLADMEFVQFYPTALGRFGNRLFLYEALVGEGAVLRNSLGQEIPSLYGMGSPADMTRDRLARAVMKEILGGRGIEDGVFLDLSAVPEKKRPRLEGIAPEGAFSEGRGFVVRPTAHFCMGGVKIGTAGETECPGLFAAGEVCAGVHGANRLGGNALAEVFVMGEVAGINAAVRASASDARELSAALLEQEGERLSSLRAWDDLRQARECLKDAMWGLGGIVRSAEGLKRGLSLLDDILGAAGRGGLGQDNLFKTLELHNMLAVGRMVLCSALQREESRGAHYREDFPDEEDGNWLGNLIVRKINGRMELSFEPIQSAVEAH